MAVKVLQLLFVTYLKIWLILDLGMENLRKTRMKRIIMSGLGARIIEK